MAIGAGLVAIGGWVTAGVAGTGLLAGAIGGALVGAAIGGISAAIMGGDIGKGILFGAIGGAITGGYAGYAAGAAGAATAGGGGVAGLSQSATVAGAGSTQIYGTAAAGHVATGGALSSGSISGSLADAGKSMAQQVGGEVVKQGIQGYMAAGAAEDQREFDAEQSALAHKRNLETIAASSGSGAASNDGSLAFKARMAELDQRKHEFKTNTDQTRTEWDTEMERRATRQGLFKERVGGGYKAPEAVASAAAGGIQEKRQANNIEDVQSQGALTGPAPVQPEEMMA